MSRVLREARHALRSLRRSPIFTLVSIATLALTIGANVAVFSVLNELVFRNLPVPDPQALVHVATVRPNRPLTPLPYPLFRELVRNQQVFSGVIGWAGDWAVNVEVDGVLSRANSWAVTGNYYSELGIRPAAGRLLTDADVTAPPALVAVLGHAFWRRQCAGNPAIIGRTIKLDGLAFTVVGIAPAGFRSFTHIWEPDVTIPLTANPIVFGERERLTNGGVWVGTIARLRPGATLNQARVHLETLWPSLKAASVPPRLSPAQRAEYLAIPIVVESAARGDPQLLRRRFGDPLYVVMGVSLLVLLLATLNLANLAVARAATRTRDVAVRRALGASRWDVTRAVIAENLMLSAAGAAAGMPLALWGMTAITDLIFEGGTFPVAWTPTIDRNVLLFMAATIVVLGAVIGTTVAWFVTRTDAGLHVRTRTDAAAPRFGRRLMTVQVAFSLALLVDVGLLLRAVERLQSLDPNFERSGVSVVAMLPRPNGFTGIDTDVYLPALVEAVRGLPNVRGVTYGGIIPAAGFPSMRRVADLANGAEADAAVAPVGPRFFDTMRLSLLRGREFLESDDSRGRRVAIVSAQLAQRLFGGAPAIGRHVRIGTATDRADLEIVGVAADATLWDLRRPGVPVVFVAHKQEGRSAAFKSMFLRTDGNLDGSAVRRAVESLGREYVTRVRTLDRQAELSLSQERVAAVVGAFFGLATLVLAAVGIYAMVWSAVAQRLPEMGIRLALGASQRQILTMMLGSTVRFVAVGLALGVGATFATVRLVRGMLADLPAWDPATVAVMSGLLVAVAVAASVMPAMRAARTDPLAVIRSD